MNKFVVSKAGWPIVRYPLTFDDEDLEGITGWIECVFPSLVLCFANFLSLIVFRELQLGLGLFAALALAFGHRGCTLALCCSRLARPSPRSMMHSRWCCQAGYTWFSRCLDLRCRANL